MSGNLAARLCMIVYAPEVIAIGHRRERAVQRKDLQTMSRQIKLANDLGTQQRHDVGADRELEAGKDFFGNGRSAQHVSPLEHQHTLARPREISGIYQTIVPATNHDDVVFAFHEIEKSY